MGEKRKLVPESGQTFLFGAGPGNPVNQSQSESETRKFDPDWKRTFSRVRHDTIKNVFFFQLCEENKKVNKFTTEVSKIFRTTALSDHAITSDHRACLLAAELRCNNLEMVRRIFTNKEKAAAVAVRVAYIVQ